MRWFGVRACGTLLFLAACADAESERTHELALEDASAPEPADAADASAPLPDASPEPVVFPRTRPRTPFLLSALGVYDALTGRAFADDMRELAPAYPRYAGASELRRALRLPPGARVDSSNMDRWQFPVGSVLVQEWSRDGVRLETRVTARTGEGEHDYFTGAFVWRDDESDAELAWDGERAVRGTDHDVPGVGGCGSCHAGEAVLGVSAVQTPDFPAELLTIRPYTSFAPPGDADARAALGYLHANCGHCHEPRGSAYKFTDLDLRLSVQDQRVAQTAAYRSTVGVPMAGFFVAGITYRIAPRLPAQSGLLYRAQQTDSFAQMPTLDREGRDPSGTAALSAFIAALP